MKAPESPDSKDWLAAFNKSWIENPARIDRLVLLRALASQAHLLRSRPATKEWPAPQLLALEEKLGRLRLTRLEQKTLTALLAESSGEPAEAEALSLPEEFERSDRHWEASIAREAKHLTWVFEELRARLSLDRVAEFHQRLTAQARAFLFVESLPEALSDTPTPPGQWSGRWLFAFPPDYPRPGTELAVPFSPPVWLRLQV